MEADQRPQSVFAVQKLLLEEPRRQESTGLLKNIYQHFSGRGGSGDKNSAAASGIPTDSR
jgi:hypothetical protein